MAARTRIKVCGITDINDAKAAVDAGVDALGFIFAEKSPRKIEPEKARNIIESLPPLVDAVGVFVDEDFEAVEEIIQYCGLTIVQLHGSETPAYCEEIPCRVLKSFQISKEQLDNGKIEFGPYFSVVAGYLFDTYHKKMAGGTGQPFDWKLIDRLKPPGSIVLAGGLSVNNISEAIKTVRPFAVDVNSGVEFEPGKKDSNAIREFVRKVKITDESLIGMVPDEEGTDLDY